VPDGKCGYVVDPEPEAIALAVADFYASRPDFSDGISAQKKQFSWSRLSGELLKLMQS